MRFYSRLGKRLFDLVLSFSLIIILLPILLLISIIVLFIDGWPIIFRQKRLGKNGREFIMIKFRTMNNNFKGNNKSDQDRITKLGKIMRKISMDELPTLFNVVMGSMSLVGPRPLLISYLKRFNNFQLKRLEVLPGITGLAQIKGRNSLSWGKKFKYDIYYVDNHNMCLDLIILIKTVFFVLRLKGITPDNQEIMPEFIGTEKNGSSKED